MLSFFRYENLFYSFCYLRLLSHVVYIHSFHSSFRLNQFNTVSCVEEYTRKKEKKINLFTTLNFRLGKIYYTEVYMGLYRLELFSLRKYHFPLPILQKFSSFYYPVVYCKNLWFLFLRVYVYVYRDKKVVKCYKFTLYFENIRAVVNLEEQTRYFFIRSKVWATWDALWWWWWWWWWNRSFCSSPKTKSNAVDCLLQREAKRIMERHDSSSTLKSADECVPPFLLWYVCMQFYRRKREKTT